MSLYTVTHERDARLLVLCMCGTALHDCMPLSTPHIVAHECDVTLRVVRVCVRAPYCVRTYLCVCLHAVKKERDASRSAFADLHTPPRQRHARVTQKNFQDLPRPPVSRVTEFMNGHLAFSVLEHLAPKQT